MVLELAPLGSDWFLLLRIGILTSPDLCTFSHLLPKMETVLDCFTPQMFPGIAEFWDEVLGIELSNLEGEDINFAKKADEIVHPARCG
jgi:hypothetical protein